MARRPIWGRPAWWTWPVEISGHALDRTVDRSFSEVDLRGMLRDARTVRPGTRPGRWVARCRWLSEDWEFVIEPDTAARSIVVVTAYPVR